MENVSSKKKQVVRIPVPDLPDFKVKNNSFTKRRGAPVLFAILCAECGSYLMTYQKDGPGPLLRCYLDRIHHPPSLEQRQHEPFHKQPAAKLDCFACKALIGTPYMYAKGQEERPAYSLQQGSFSMQKV